jgi:tRNA(Ile)-lysidine synthase
MLEAFTSYIKSKNLFTNKDRILLTVSGGVDSIVMTELFHQAGFEFGIAHVNFQLRGKESDGDEQFVKDLAKKYNVPFYVNTFDTEAYAKENGISTQMAARDLRYQFFDELCKEYKYDYIATAHHKDDQLETFFINLFRGTGISGLRGILPKQNNIVRPLLCADRKTIEQFQQSEQLKFREDSSNKSVKYLRNKIRHNLIPVLEDIDPNYLDLMIANMNRIGESEQIYKNHINTLQAELIHKKSQTYYINIERIKQLNPCTTYVYELLKNYNFSFSTCESIVGALNNESGKVFESETHELLKDREDLIIRVKRNEKFEPILINEGELTKSSSLNLVFQDIQRDNNFEISRQSHIACIDKSKLEFPLTIRKWKQGDFFYPLGSKYKKKLSDFFIDKKFSLFEKEDVILLCTGTKIVWIIEHQIDDRFKITSQTKDILNIERITVSLK